MWSTARNPFCHLSSIDRQMSRIHTRGGGFMCTCVCVCTCISTGVGVCAYSYGPDHPDMRIWGRDCADFQNLPRIRSHLNKQTKTHGYRCSRELQKKIMVAIKLWKRKISQCELTKAGNRLTIVSVSWFTPLCKSQQFSPVSIALNNSQQFPNLRFPTIFANLRFSSPQIGAQASRHGKQEHFDPH